MSDEQGLTYKDAGVDIEAGEALVDAIGPAAARTRRPEVLTGLGGFGALFELPLDRYRRPVLVAGTDGVGTKLRLAIDYGRHDGVGIDLVAMCVNDILAQGAEPLFFLDYYATSQLDVTVASAVVEGIAEGCVQAGCALVGGETAEMPGMYHSGDYDLAGFAVGVVERDAIIDPAAVEVGDTLIALASSGAHSNGYSLIRKVLELSETDPQQHQLDGKPLIDALIEPTRIYVRPVLAEIAAGRVHALAHITGGGITENLPRALPEGCRARIDLSSWQRPALFDWLAQSGGIEQSEMLRTFNCGVGMVLMVPPSAAEASVAALCAAGEHAWCIGEVVAGEAGVEYQA